MTDVSSPWIAAARLAWDQRLRSNAGLIWEHCIPDQGGEHEAIEALLSDPSVLRNVNGDDLWMNVTEAFDGFIGFDRSATRSSDTRLVFYCCCMQVGMFLNGVCVHVDSVGAALAGGLWAAVHAKEDTWLRALAHALEQWPDAFGHEEWDRFADMVARTAVNFTSTGDLGSRAQSVQELLEGIEAFAEGRGKEMICDLPYDDRR